MNRLEAKDFREFFQALHGHDPYSWQIRLAERAIAGDWPKQIDLPTGSGKTSCIDIAVFALAVHAERDVEQRSAPRRIIFCVNRRVIVDEAYDRAREIAKKLREAEVQADDRSILGNVARALRKIAGTTLKDKDSPPLDVLELRGGIYRDNRWARSPTQATVICTTVDQLGSRLLFRGYGVSPNAAPIQAALLAYNSLVLLDEAHISRPFLETLRRVRDYLDPNRWAEQEIGAEPMIVVPMSATLDNVDPDQVVRLDEADKKNASLKARLDASKPAELQMVKNVSDAIVKKAIQLGESGPMAIGIIVNRVATAKEIYQKLHGRHDDVHLVIGAMRPIDRDDQSERLAKLIGKERPDTTNQPSIIIATQCLEVGADYDFDVLLTECASIDALRQRFGRLNRKGREIEGGDRAVIFLRDKDLKTTEELDKDDTGDPIYGNALAMTWNWLVKVSDPAKAQPAEQEQARRKAKSTDELRTIDFGIDRFNSLLDKPANGRIPDKLLAPSASKHAPVMLPAYADFWCQTSPKPVPDPDVSLFIHGEKSDQADVQVCWRDDLALNRTDWCDVVGLLPPTSAECMSVPIVRVLKWLRGDSEGSPNLCDLLEIASPTEPEADSESDEAAKTVRRGVIWRGAKQSQLYPSKGARLKPGDTLVLPVSDKGWDELGHIPPGTPEDRAEDSFKLSRGKWALRIHPSQFPTPTEKVKNLLDLLTDPEDRPSPSDLRKLATDAFNECKNDNTHKYSFNIADYPDKQGVVLISRKRIPSIDDTFLSPIDDGEDEPSWLAAGKEVTLKDHTKHVCKTLERLLELLPTASLKEAYLTAAELHDWGKVDDRFQALLRGTNRTDAWLFQGKEPEYIAKSADGPNRLRKFTGHGLPDGFRHEMLSAQMADRQLSCDFAERDFILHLIASHHGRARPFAPVVDDQDPPEICYKGVELKLDDRKNHPAHRCDSGVADRFWSLTRRFGWWGLAYLEALLRLADQQASANEANPKDFQEPSELEEGKA